jgi:lipopolysaccharide/colanic/teichoic acid biosynthesis glycosyltransferase
MVSDNVVLQKPEESHQVAPGVSKTPERPAALGSNRLKRNFDLALLALSFPIWATALGLLAGALWLQGQGSIFYLHKRIGFRGDTFAMWKFRTMVEDSDQVLQHYLDANPEAVEEWLATQKLKNDPRVTRVGRILRRYSLDELPQTINVLLGDMSLVGPRPIYDPNEVAQWGDLFAYYTLARPGLTGLWQVSGRNNTTYAERVAYDISYVTGWSLKLDCSLIARTARVVLTGEGAY